MPDSQLGKLFLCMRTIKSWTADAGNGHVRLREWHRWLKQRRLLFTLHQAHSMVQSQLPLDDWDVLWRSADGLPSFVEYTSRTAHHTTQVRNTRQLHY